MSDPIRAHVLRRRGAHEGAEPAADSVRLDYEARFLRRRRLVTLSGAAVLVDLPETVSLEDGDALICADGTAIAVEAEPEPLLSVSGPDLARLAWHVGNRHTPCQIEADRLLIRDDHVLADMLRRLGAALTPLTAPFRPEGGAYGHGRTMGHSHGPGQGHGEGHAHGSHDHGDGHDHDHDHGAHGDVHGHARGPGQEHGPR